MTSFVPGPTVRRVARDPGGARGGIPCPECGGRIEITLDDLLVRRAFACATIGCNVVLRLDQRESSGALDTLRELKHRLREIGSEP
jgi:hypothetical protein